MRKSILVLFTATTLGLVGCAVKKGCPSSGRNIGAERILSGDPKLKKDLRKAGKFKGGKF